MAGYYTRGLAAERLQACYECAPPRVRTYLEAEIAHGLERVTRQTHLLELGCGTGRALRPLSEKAARAVGIDTSPGSLQMAVAHLPPAVELVCMDASRMGFADRSFDLTLCIQNGIGAFAVAPAILLKEALRVTRRGGSVMFSTYAERFWPHRLEWFEIQSRLGLIGEIDREKSGAGTIVCRDGFRATTVSPEQFRALAASLGLAARLTEVDGSSLFCELTAP